MAKKVKAEVQVYEIKGEKVGVDEKDSIDCESHWADGDMVVLKVHGKTVTVQATDLIEAIQACLY